VPNEEQYPLADLIEALGAQLREAEMRAKAAGDPLLRLKECTVEMAVDWRRDGQGGIEFWVIKLGGQISKQTSQTLTVTLDPTGGERVMDLSDKALSG
jgi:Trypsin-co-occurring domain 2